MFHPWRALRALEHVELHMGRLPSGVRGASTAGGVWIDSRQLQAERRSTLAHELVHLERGDHGHQSAAIEREVEQEAARRLIPMSLLLDKLSWTESFEELADECWVDVPMLLARLDGLSAAEKAMIRDLYERTERGA